MSSTLSRFSAALLLVGGVALLFVPDVLLPLLVPMALLATIYGALLLRGPFDPLQSPAD